MRAAVVIALVGCGRLNFDAGSAAIDASGDAPGDTSMMADAPVTFPSGLVVRFPLDGQLDDVVGPIDGACGGVACPSPAPGHIGQGYKFDGVDDCINVGDVGQFSHAKITLAVWANQLVDRNMSQVSKQVLTGSVNSWQLESNALDMVSLSLTFTTYNGNTNQFATSAQGKIVLSQWQHLAATYDGTTKRLYINGSEVAMVAHGALMYDNKPMKIGCDDNAGNALFYEGTLDELQIYDRALTPNEIAMLAQR